MSDWITDELPAYETTTVVCRCPKCHEVVPLLVTSEAGSHILRIEVGEEGIMRKTDVSNRMERFKNVVVTYDKTTGYLYIDDEETDEQLAIFYVQEEE